MKGNKATGSSSLAASVVGGGHILASANLDLVLIASSTFCTSSKPLLDLLGHGLERVLDIGGLLGRSLDERNSHAVSKLLGDGSIHHLLIGHIALVSDEQLVDTLSGVAVNFLEPLLDVVERLLLSSIVDNNDSVCATVVRRGNGAESLLASCIPLCLVSSVTYARRLYVVSFTYDLELDGLAVKFNSSNLEIDADRRNVGLSVGILCKSKQQT